MSSYKLKKSSTIFLWKKGTVNSALFPSLHFHHPFIVSPLCFYTLQVLAGCSYSRPHSLNRLQIKTASGLFVKGFQVLSRFEQRDVMQRRIGDARWSLVADVTSVAGIPKMVETPAMAKTTSMAGVRPMGESDTVGRIAADGRIKLVLSHVTRTCIRTRQFS